MYSYCFHELPVALEKKGKCREALAKELKLHQEQIFNLEVERFSLDSRRKGAPHWSYNVRFEVQQKLKTFGNNAKGLVEAAPAKQDPKDAALAGSLQMPGHVDIVGAGPSGLWAALHLLRKGYSVDLYEQGKPVEERFRDIRRFFVDRKFNARSNVLFGEGGAGAFSDGKLNTRSRNAFSEQVLHDMVDFGVDQDVITFAKPHIGTDRLVLMLRKIRAEITRLGGHIHFYSALTDVEIQNGCISAIKIEDESTPQGAWKRCEALVLATGHSCRDIYQMLQARGVALESKAFAMGVRVEHPQELINLRQLGRGVDTRLTGAAEYFLATPTLDKTCSAYSFCMCPGGVLVPCASEPGTLATNGMSYSRRNGPLANGAIVVPVEASGKLFGGLEFQRKTEADAFDVGGKNYSAPAQTIKAFMEHRLDKSLPKSTYPCGIVPVNTWDWLDQRICQSLYEGFLNFDRKIPGFIAEGLIVAPETRTSSPLRITRDSATLESVNTRGLFVLGEGAGYAGGIVTSAADGVRLAYYAKNLKDTIQNSDFGIRNCFNDNNSEFINPKS
jgi:uncharacterized FAD-dependent dehydrogenase